MQNVQLEGDAETEASNSLIRRVGGELFLTERFPVRLDLRAVHVCDISEINVVLISNFNELHGLPYLPANGFKGKIYMTRALSQIGRSLMNEFVSMVRDRDQEAFVFSAQ